MIHSDPFLAALLELGLGRESAFFQFRSDRQSFWPLIDDAHMSGYSVPSFKSLTDLFTTYGNHMRNLGIFVDRTYDSRKSPPTLIALAESVSTIMKALMTFLTARSINPASVLQLQMLYDRPGRILSFLDEITANVHAATNNEELLQQLYEYIQTMEYTDNWLRSVILQLLARVSKPWLESIGACLGLHAPTVGYVPTQRQFDDGERIKDSVSLEPMPDFVASKDFQAILQTSKNLRLLDTHSPNHCLTRRGLSPIVQAPKLEWHFRWQDIARVETKAKQYEASVLQAINSCGNVDVDCALSSENVDYSSQLEIATFGVSEGVTHEQINASYAAFENIVSELSFDADGSDYMESVISAITNDTEADGDNAPTFAPPLSINALLSFSPIISAQARLVNSACLRLLLKDHRLRSHLSLQRRYHLFGDGLFVSRLSHALFDTDLQSTERRKGHARSGLMGLKLGSRDTWPPASSELRLALMGILAETYHSQLPREEPFNHQNELPGGLSFAIRDVSEEELQRCLNPDSIEALDFLRLQYKPPSPLDTVITPACLDKYDAIFKLLLRMARMLYVVNQLSRTALRRSRREHTDLLAQRFRHEAYHFVSTICEYFFNTSIGANWDAFESKLDEVERSLDHTAMPNGYGMEDKGLHQLEEYHERVLDRMMFALFLRKRQKHVMKLLEDIFSAILVFARHSTMTVSGDTLAGAFDVKEQYQVLRKNIRVFISVCKGLSESQGQGHSRRTNLNFTHVPLTKDGWSEGGGETIGQLLLKLEMNGYYSLPEKKV